jgi:hypothetical protein
MMACLTSGRSHIPPRVMHPLIIHFTTISIRSDSLQKNQLSPYLMLVYQPASSNYLAQLAALDLPRKV